MRGLLYKIVRETWLATVLFGVALLLVQVLLNFILPQIREGMNDMLLRIPFMQAMVSAMLGTDLGDGLTAPMLHAIIWVHPTVLAIAWAHEIVFCTRFPVAEIDRGTIDVLLGWPLSRRRVYLGESLVWLASGVVIVGMGVAGNLASAWWTAGARPPTGRVLLVAGDLLAMYVAVGGATYLVASTCDRRGRAVAAAFTFVLASFLLNFLASFWELASHLSFLSVLSYYQPAEIMGGREPVGDLFVLLLFGGACWVLAGEIVARRSLCTV